MIFFYHSPELGPEFIRRLFGTMNVTYGKDRRQITDWLVQGNSPSAWVAGMHRGQKARVFRWMSSTLALGKKAKASPPEADQSALSKARRTLTRRGSSSTGFSPARGRARCKNTWTCTARFPPTRAVLLSRKKISRPKAGLSRGENISMSHGPNGRTWNRFSSWSKKSRPAGTRNRLEGREQQYAISRTKRDADAGRSRDAGRRTAASLLAPDRHRNGYLRRESGEVRSDPW